MRQCRHVFARQTTLLVPLRANAVSKWSVYRFGQLRNEFKTGFSYRLHKIPRSLEMQEDREVSHTAAEVLWGDIQHVYSQAEGSGAILKIHSSPESLEDDKLGLKFVMQVAETFKDKPKSTAKSRQKPADAFASADQDLTIKDPLTTTHMLRLNKFNVIPYHSLVITRAFESQQARITFEDWEATLQTMQAYPQGAMAYFNSGEEAGASQPRKHLQILPLILDEKRTAPLTFERAAQEGLTQQTEQSHAVPLRDLPFQCFAASLPSRYLARDLLKAYNSLLSARPNSSAKAAFNVLLANNVMMLIPRRQEKCGPISCNALIFAGTLLVRTEEELEFVRREGPMHIVENVTFPWES